MQPTPIFLQPLRISIIGAGPGGLTLARLLQMNGLNVQVFERDLNREVRVQGATLNLNPGSGLLAIEKAGLQAELNRHYRPGAEKMIFLDQQAKTLFSEKPHEGEESRPEIDRGPLRNLLLDSLKPDTVVWDAQFQSLEEHADQTFTLHFKNGTRFQSDLVIACDGANSKVRPYVTSILPVYSGVTAVEGTIENVSKAIPELHRLLDGGKICALGEEKSIMLVLKGDDSVAFYAGLNLAEGELSSSRIDFTHREEVKQWFQSQFKEWSPLFHDVIAKAKLPLIARPQSSLPVNQPWTTKANLTLLGDAAHVMPPYSGEGVNMAMLDAVELTEHLLNPNHSHLRAALKAYENQMQERMKPVQEETLQFTSIFHSSEAVPFFSRFFNTPLS